MIDEKYTEIIGVSQNIKKIRELIKTVAGTGFSVLITGETGTGKELVARSLFEHSDRKNSSFVKVNCAALPDTLMESELFGYERGAFTGANQNRQGRFQLANNGALFLDEIGDMSFYLQSKLLRALQDGSFSPLGSEKEIQSDAWVISATNKNLENEIKDKNFRSDLFYRLNTINIHVEPLRKRPEDIQLLIEHYFNLYNGQLNQNKVFENEIPGGVMALMLEYHWPGNVRELQNVIKRIIIFGCNEETIEFMKMDKSLLNETHTAENTSDIRSTESNAHWETRAIEEFFTNKSGLSLKDIGKAAVEKAERQVILHVLRQTRWNRKKATKILNVSYPALLYKMKDLSIYPN